MSTIAKAAFSKLYPIIAPLYNEKDRVYHDIRHLKDFINSINHIDRYVQPHYMSQLSENDMTVLHIAALGHDAYYDPKLGSPVNEQLSLGITVDAIERTIDVNMISSDQLAQICTCIEASSTHLVFNEQHSTITKIFLDLDMLGFAQPDYEKYIENSNRIVDEYLLAGFDKSEIRLGRIKFLQSLLESRKNGFYYTLDPNLHYIAVDNVQREIEDLRILY